MSFTSIIAVLVSLGALFFARWTLECWLAAATALAILIAIALSRTRAYKAVVAAKAEFEKEYPSFVVQLDDAANETRAVAVNESPPG